MTESQRNSDWKLLAAAGLAISLFVIFFLFRDRKDAVQAFSSAGTVVAAFAAAYAAYGAARAARSSSVAARRATEAIGRAQKPELELDVHIKAERGPGGIPMYVAFVTNRSMFTARDVDLTVYFRGPLGVVRGRRIAELPPARTTNKVEEIDLGPAPDAHIPHREYYLHVDRITAQYRDPSSFCTWELTQSRPTEIRDDMGLPWATTIDRLIDVSDS